MLAHGTKVFRALEVKIGKANSPKSDVWSLGVVLGFLLLNTHPDFYFC
jgi:serine/threonine protein kinase